MRPTQNQVNNLQLNVSRSGSPCSRPYQFHFGQPQGLPLRHCLKTMNALYIKTTSLIMTDLHLHVLYNLRSCYHAAILFRVKHFEFAYDKISCGSSEKPPQHLGLIYCFSVVLLLF